MNSKRKGSAGERELCSLLQQAGLAHRNDQMYKGGVDNPDVSFQAGGHTFHVECKRTEKLSLYEAFEQAEHDANGHAVPVVMHRRSRKPWLCVMLLEDWLKLVGGKTTEWLK